MSGQMGEVCFMVRLERLPVKITSLYVFQLVPGRVHTYRAACATDLPRCSFMPVPNGCFPHLGLAQSIGYLSNGSVSPVQPLNYFCSFSSRYFATLASFLSCSSNVFTMRKSLKRVVMFIKTCLVL